VPVADQDVEVTMALKTIGKIAIPASLGGSTFFNPALT
jgi:hypothetical protein